MTNTPKNRDDKVVDSETSAMRAWVKKGMPKQDVQYGEPIRDPSSQPKNV